MQKKKKSTLDFYSNFENSHLMALSSVSDILGFDLNYSSFPKIISKWVLFISCPLTNRDYPFAKEIKHQMERINSIPTMPRLMQLIAKSKYNLFDFKKTKREIVYTHIFEKV